MRARVFARGRLRRPYGLMVCSLAFVAAGAGCSSRQDADVWADAAVILPSPAAAGSRFPSLANTPDGTVILSWTAPTAEGGFELAYSIYSGNGWSAASRAVSGRDWFVNWADFASVVPVGEALWAAQWLEQRPGSAYAYDLRLAVSRDRGATWSAPLSPHDDGTPTEHGFASIAPWKEALIAVWLDGRNTGGGEGHDSAHGATALRAALVDSHGQLPAGDAEIDARVCDCCQTDVAQADGGLVVAYRDRDADEVRDIAVVRATDAGWSTPVSVNRDDWRIAACPVNGPAIAANGDTVAVAWYTAPDQPRIRLAFSGDAGRSFAPPLEVSTGRVAGRVDVVLLDRERAVVSWLSETAGGAEIRAQLWTPRGAAAPPLVVARSSAERATGFPRMAASGDTLLFAWTEAGTTPVVRTALVRLR